jgi:predicted enzyme related to lactoylglutathione lyase
MPDGFGNGRLTYIQIPALDALASAAFYRDVFGWQNHGGDAQHTGFADATGDMIGAFVTEWEPREPGVIPYISVDDVEATLERVTASGGTIHTAAYPEGDLTVARFTDPAGNVIGIWKMPDR